MKDSPARRLPGANQYGRAPLDAFLDAQRDRVAQVLEQHTAQLRRRLRAYADDVAASEAELADADDGDDRSTRTV